MMRRIFCSLVILFAINTMFAQMQFFRNSTSLNAGTAGVQTRKFALETLKEQQVQKLELDSNVRIVPQENNNSSIAQVKYSANGNYLLSADDNNAKIWDVASGRLIRSIEKAHKGILSSKNADLSSDGTICVYVSPKLDVEICDIKIGSIKRLVSFPNERPDNISLAVSPNDKFLAVLTHYDIYIYDLISLKLIMSKKSNTFSFFDFPIFTADSKKLGMIASGKNSYDMILFLTISTQQFSSVVSTGNHSRFLDVSTDGRLFCYSEESQVLVIADAQKGKVIKKIVRKTPYAICDIKFSLNGEQIFVSTLRHKNTEIYDSKTGELSLLPVGGLSITFSPDKKSYCIGKSGKIEIYDMSSNNLQKIISGASEIQYWNANSFNNGNIIYFEANKTSIILDKNFEPIIIDKFYVQRQIPKDSGKYYIKQETENSYSVYYHPYFDNSDYKVMDVPEISAQPTLLANSDAHLLGVRTKDNKVHIYEEKKYLGYYETYDELSGFISPARKFVVSDGAKKIYILNMSNGSIRQLDSDRHLDIVFSHDDKYVAVNGKPGQIEVYDTTTWETVKHFDGYGASCFSRTGKYFGTCMLETVHIYDFKTGKEIRTIATDTGKFISFNEDDSKFIFCTLGGIIKIFSTATGNLLASIMADDTGDWFTYTPEGYFYGSENGINKFVHLVDGMKVSELGQYAETHFRPDLVAAKLRGVDLTEFTENTSLAKIISTGEAPLVQFTNTPTNASSRDVSVHFSVQDMGGGIGAVYVKLNGKVIQLADGSRKLELVGENTSITQQQGGKATQFSHLLTLSNGENTIEAYATNAAGLIESRHATTKITWQGTTAKPNLYVLSVGVNKYRDRSLWLNYSVPDAQSISQSFGRHKTSLYQNIFTYELLDENVTKEKLVLQFKELSHKVGVDDVFVLFVAGHGTTNQKTGDYYFIPSNFRYTDSEAILAQGISKTDILGYMSGIKAEKTLIMLDTCNSGAFINDTAQRGFAEKTALERLIRATGQAVLSAASEEQSAMEGYEGHGVFTYVLLEALQGKADKNADGYTTVNELAAYIEEQVPELSYQKWGYEQVPMKELKKQDFPLVEK